MLAENKIGRYLLYALGEIVLVMIGILLALQVNNWNQSEKGFIIEKQLVNLLISDLEEKRKENRQDLSAANNFIAKFTTTLDYWEEKREIDTNNLKRNLVLLGTDFYFLNENSPLYATLSSTNLWKEMPYSLTKQIDIIYRLRLKSVQIVFEKTNEYGTYCKLNFLVPNNLIDLKLSNSVIHERVAKVDEEFIHYAKLFLNNCQRLKIRLKLSEEEITKLIGNLESYIELKQ
jgi:hypothetical protein